MATLDFDVIVVGGGVAGAACAALLAQQQRRVALVDARRPSFRPAEGRFDPRVVAISPGSRRVLAAAGGWQLLSAERLASYRRMAVHAAALSVHFNAADHGLLELGWIVEIPAMEDALWQSLDGLERVTIFAPAAWERVDLGAETVRLSLTDGQTLRSALLVAADGARSRLRRLAGVATDEWHYNQRALIAPVRTEQANTGLAWQRFTEHGPLALLPLPDGRSSIVWSQPSDRALALQTASEGDFLADINNHQDAPLGAIIGVGQRHALPLVRRRARRLFRDRLVLLGDAARTVHPLAGQGLNLGLMDAATLVEVLEAWKSGSPAQELERYQRWRQSNGTLIGGGIHAINELVRAPGGLGRHALGAGFGIATRLWPLREAFVQRACGIDSDSPRLARSGCAA
ncbi:FAD-dependent oxidoreductase [Wenzhouxiangella limi]|uniref:FAD-dependent oxidoreductase n=1 Tax=Wenzhouxiangella limi TaxID=2707351 RepID=A0A845V2U7_9GAMM|nr:FAD-dependent oxidoreductase [Wenzhouxiangella limi]NDY96590.1 FAD-dependent oxidoreductase [Wenzhouxiangella limi]